MKSADHTYKYINYTTEENIKALFIAKKKYIMLDKGGLKPKGIKRFQK